MKKKIISMLCTFVLLTQSVHASILGSEITGWSHDIANGTKVYRNSFMSEQSGVGQQVEYFAEYTPNSDVVPTVVNGQSVWGFRTITKAEEYMTANGMVPLIGINASYFSMENGVPMGHVITDGRIISKDGGAYQSIGFTNDGKAFIAPLSIQTTLIFGETAVDIEHINKYNQPVVDIVNLYTSDFDEQNHNNCTSLNLILGSVKGEIAVGEAVTAVVEEKFNYTGAIKLPSDKIVLTINETGKTELYDALNSLNVGDEVTISTSADDIWKDAVSAIGSVGDTLVKNGEVQSGFATGAAPRTAVGITENGNVIFYVIDGRQQPYSYGVQLKTLAARMKELGCVDAINLDGGGSTAISGIYPGTDSSAVLNTPSEGRLRASSNYIFLKNANEPTGELGHLYLYPFEQHYLSGYSERIYPVAADTTYYKTDLPYGIEFEASGESTIDDGGMLTALGDGRFTVSVTGGGVTGAASYTVYETPTEINVYNAASGTEIKSLKLKMNDSLKLSMSAKYNHINLKSSNECFTLEVDDKIGYIENNELFITSDGGEGELRVIAGDYIKKIPISVEYENSFKDTNEHWARSMINDIYKKGIISGYELDGGLYFKPESSITREEFAVIACNFLGLDTSKYSDFDLTIFDDASSISDWARPYVAAAFDNSLISGKAEGEALNFASKDTLTRAEAMTILGRTLEEYGIETGFADNGDIPDWAKQYISAMVLAGYVTGYEDNTIKPHGSVTRAEAVTIIYKMMK